MTSVIFQTLIGYACAMGAVGFGKAGDWYWCALSAIVSIDCVMMSNLRYFELRQEWRDKEKQPPQPNPAEQLRCDRDDLYGMK